MKQKILVTFIISMMAQVAMAKTLPDIDVVAQPEQKASSTVSKQSIESYSSAKSDLVDILSQSPSVSVNPAGGLSGFPVMRGMADQRLDVQVDGMPLMSSCPNHMNTPLSYISPSQTDSVEIYPGITPVSVGGDSLGGSVLVKTKAPVFSDSDQQLTEGEIGTAYQGNGAAQDAHLTLTTASRKLNLTYKGNYAKSNNRHAAKDFKDFTTTTNAMAGTEFTSGAKGTTTKQDEIAGTAYQSINHNLSVAYKGEQGLTSLTLINQTTPYQQYPNQRMDMTKNDSNKVNFAYERMMNWGELNIQAYTEQVKHEMAFMDYKTSMQMPMASDSQTNGMKLAIKSVLNANMELDFGTEAQQYRLDDYWNPNASAPGMSPNTFQNINGGARDRYSVYAELHNQLNSKWKTRMGARYEQVSSNAGKVNGYHDSDSFMGMMTNPSTGMKMPVTMTTNEASEAAAFNASDRAKTDNNVNVTLMANYEASDSFNADFGLARQVRSPDLYERYTWSTWSMAALMNNFAGDGNGYVGDVSLKPETAYTLSANLDWHASQDDAWSVQVMPYVSQVDNYIDATLVKSYGDFSVLKYANQSARLYGVDAETQYRLTKDMLGAWTLKVKVNYTKGSNQDTNGDLYNVMPLNGKVTFAQNWQSWRNALEVVMVDKKNAVSDVRNELQTAGYSLVNLRAAYIWKMAKFDFGVENAFNTDYNLPTGGAYTGEGNTMSVTGVPLMSVPGQGRNFYAGVNVKF